MAERRMIGLDIGSGSVRAAEVGLSGSEVAFYEFGQVGLPGGAVSAGVVVDQGAVTLALQQLWKERKFSSRDVITGVSNQQVIVRAIDLPWVEPEDLKRSLPYLVREVLPIPVDEAVLDFLPLEAEPTRGEPINGLLVASPRDSVTSMVRCVERAGLRPTAVDLTSFALLRAVARGPASAGTEALVDIGATITNIVVHEWGLPRVVRIVVRGGADVSAVLADRLGISGPEAEDLKRREGLTATDGETATLVRLAVMPLVEEIRSSLDYFTAIHGGARVDRIRLCGGGSLLPGLRQAVEDRLRVRTELTDPMVDLDVRGKHLDAGQLDLFRPLSAVPIGLALGAA